VAVFIAIRLAEDLDAVTVLCEPVDQGDDAGCAGNLFLAKRDQEAIVSVPSPIQS